MMVHNVFAHSAHHAHAGIPSYRLFEAQRKLDDMLGDCAISEPMTLRGVLRTMKTCKLYDYEAHRWLDFDGRATADINVASTLGAAAPEKAVVGMRSSLEHA
jgi:omega-6 fatty acid desaturase (delta-12 desaturase)